MFFLPLSKPDRCYDTCSWNSYHLYFMASTKMCSDFFFFVFFHSFRCVKIDHFHIAFKQNLLKHIYHNTWKTYFRMWMKQVFLLSGIKWKTYEFLILFLPLNRFFYHFWCHNFSTNERKTKKINMKTIYVGNGKIKAKVYLSRESIWFFCSNIE